MSTNTGMKELIVTINKLQDVFTITGQNLGLELPQIAVVGGQSAGKSSVLENFVGKDFLPRGAGIVTRRPLVLQLYHSTDGEWAEFLHGGSKKYTNFDDVRKEIEDETDRETGSNKGISKKPINLRVFSPHVLDLTLIDLPGLTKVPVGDQPDDIEYLIKEMIEEYISQENTIILAVSPANQDLANSDALKLARRVDPEGRRTIGVITKLDLMDEGTDAREIFEGKLLPLKKGYIGVVNRSQKDIDDKKSIVQAMEKERDFFRDSPYKSMTDRMGTRFLQETLNEQLGKHIQEKLPGIKTNMQKKVKELNDSLKEMGYFDQAQRSKIKLLYRILNQFSEHLAANVEGRSLDVSASHVKAGAAINRTIYGDVYSLINSAVKEPNDYEISMIVANLSGYRNALFPDTLSFDIPVRALTLEYKKPLTASVDTIKSILVSAVEAAIKQFLDGYPKLEAEVLYLVNSNIIKCEEITVNHLMAHIDAQRAFMNTRHPDFRQMRYKMEPNLPPASGKQSDTSNEPEDEDLNEEVQKGHITLLTTGFRMDKEMFVVITRGKLTVFKDESHQIKNKELVSFSIAGCECESKESPKGRHYIIYRSDGKSLYKSEKRLELLAVKANEEQWTEAFKELGIFQDVQGSLSSLAMDKPKKGLFGGLLSRSSAGKKNSTSLADDVRKDPMIQEQTSLLCKMVRAYMKIINTTILDMAPKYIIMSLIQATIQYVKEDLVGDLVDARKSDEEKEELMETGSDDKRRIEQLVAMVNATKQALDIVSNIGSNQTSC